MQKPFYIWNFGFLHCLKLLQHAVFQDLSRMETASWWATLVSVSCECRGTPVRYPTLCSSLNQIVMLHIHGKWRTWDLMTLAGTVLQGIFPQTHPVHGDTSRRLSLGLTLYGVKLCSTGEGAL